MVSVTVMIKEGTTTSAVTVDSRSEERLADADEIEAALVHVTRPSAQMYLRSLITNLRKEGKALQRVAASTNAASSSASVATTAGSDDSAAAPSPAPTTTTNLRKEAMQFTSEDSASPTVQSTLIAVGSPTPLPASATDRVATPPEITPVNEPTITISPMTRCTITPANKNQVFPAQYESPDDKIKTLINHDKIETLINQYNQRAKKEMAKAIAAANEKENVLTAPVLENEGEGTQDKARERSTFIIDVSDVPAQPPITKRVSHIKENASKYVGVWFDKRKKKWTAQIYIDGKTRYIGAYDDEDEAAVNYARAVFKYRSEKNQPKTREQSLFTLDLSDVPAQPPVLKRGHIKEGTSKYVGVYFDKRKKKWIAQIHIDGKTRLIGAYDDEDEAAVNYARAVFKYRSGKKQNAREQSSLLADLNDIPPQPLILREGTIKDGASKYAGVYFAKSRNKWMARIRIDGKKRHIGYYVNDEEAAVDYARAAFKYRSEKKAETEKTQNAPETAKRKRPPCAEDEDKSDASKRLKNAEKDNYNHMQAIKLEEDCCW